MTEQLRYTAAAGAVEPSFAYEGDAGMDLAVQGEHRIMPDERLDLPTGVAIQLPEGYYARLVGRSSTLRKRGLFVFEGIIDQGYRGPLFVYVENKTRAPIVVADGSRIAQIIVQPIVQPVLTKVDQLDDSERGAKGFGSSGL
jgi:dUTP pyrophosphatase